MLIEQPPLLYRILFPEAIWRIKRKKQRVVYLTFDDGPIPEVTPWVLDTLDKYGIKATFFMVGDNARRHPWLVEDIKKRGHSYGNHTMHHPDMSKISDEVAFRRELETLEKLYKQTTGEEMPKFYRPPQGIYSEENLKMAQKMGYKTVFWSLAYVDWKTEQQPAAEYAFSKLLPRTHNGAVVLLHSTSATNAAILDELLTRWEKMGYTFAPLEELFG